MCRATHIRFFIFEPSFCSPAIEAKDYDSAARKTFRVLHGAGAGASGSDPSSASASLPPSDSSYAALLTLQSRVRALVTAECEAAERNTQWSHVLRLTRLYPTLGISERGLHLYCTTVGKMFVAQLTKLGLTLPSFPPGAVIPYSEVTSQVIVKTAQVLATHSPLVNTAFGAGTAVRLIQELQKTTDGVLEPVVRAFASEQKVMARVAQIKTAKLQLQKPGARLREGKGKPPQTHATEAPVCSVAGKFIV